MLVKKIGFMKVIILNNEPKKVQNSNLEPKNYNACVSLNYYISIFRRQKGQAKQKKVAKKVGTGFLKSLIVTLVY